MIEDDLNANTDWVEVLNLIEQGKFEEKYPKYNLNKRINGYFIERDKEKIFLFNKQREIEFIFPAEEPRKVKIFTSKDIERYIKENKKDIKKLYIKGEDNIKYEEYIENLGFFLIGSKLEIRQNPPLPEFKLQNAFSMDEDYSPNEYSKYFYDYFEYEDKKKENEKFLFQNNEIRKIIFDNIEILYILFMI